MPGGERKKGREAKTGQQGNIKTGGADARKKDPFMKDVRAQQQQQGVFKSMPALSEQLLDISFRERRKRKQAVATTCAVLFSSIKEADLGTIMQCKAGKTIALARRNRKSIVLA